MRGVLLFGVVLAILALAGSSAAWACTRCEGERCADGLFAGAASCDVHPTWLTGPDGQPYLADRCHTAGNCFIWIISSSGPGGGSVGTIRTTSGGSKTMNASQPGNMPGTSALEEPVWECALWDTDASLTGP